MGVIRVTVAGSFPDHETVEFSAMARGHAHAVAETIEWLSKSVLPKAIQLDHELHRDGHFPSHGFVV